MSASQPIEWTVAQLAQAVERGQLELHYQPIVDLRSEQIVGAEALLRWRHPTLGLLPPGQFPITDLPPAHPMFRTLFEVATLPQIPSINSWRGLGGSTSELGEDSAEPSIRTISDRAGRIMVVMTHNTDISDAWEREAADPRYFFEFSPAGYAVGLNIAIYAMSH